MSQQSTYPIACPHCEHTADVALFDSINVQESPELRDQLFQNELNQVDCPSCGTTFRIDKPLLYNDPEQRILIYWIPTADTEIEAGQHQFRSSLQQLTQLLPDDLNLPDVHLVFSRAELVERIFLFEAGLDERIVEYVKYMMYSQNMQKIKPEEKRLLFNAQDSTPETLCFVVQDLGSKTFEAVLHYDRTAYDALCELFDRDEETANLMELFPGPYISARSLMLKDSELRKD